MKRRRLIIILSLLINILLITNISAQDISSDSSISISLYHNEPSSFSILVPKVFDVSADDSILTYYVKGDIKANQNLTVIFSASDISNTYENIPISVTQDKSSWTFSQLSENYTAYQIHITHTHLKAGRYSGNLCVDISLQEE